MWYPRSSNAASRGFDIFVNPNEMLTILNAKGWEWRCFLSRLLSIVSSLVHTDPVDGPSFKFFHGTNKAFIGVKALEGVKVSIVLPNTRKPTCFKRTQKQWETLQECLGLLCRINNRYHLFIWKDTFSMQLVSYWVIVHIGNLWFMSFCISCWHLFISWHNLYLENHSSNVVYRNTINNHKSLQQELRVAEFTSIIFPLQPLAGKKGFT